MKVAFIILFLLSFFPLITHAKLTTIENIYIEKLQSGSPIEVKAVAAIIDRSGIRKFEVLDVVADVLLQRYRNATEREVQAMSRLARTLGNTGNSRYFNTLKEVHDSTYSRKIKKHAGQALKNIKYQDKGYTKNSVALLSVPLSRTQKMLLNMLVSNDDKQIKDAASYIIHANVFRYEIFDAALDTLSNNYPKEKGETSISANWAARLIAHSYSNKYMAPIQNIAKKTKNASFRRRLLGVAEHLKPLRQIQPGK